jgi:hypothetical protein
MMPMMTAPMAMSRGLPLVSGLFSSAKVAGRYQKLAAATTTAEMPAEA